MLTKRFWTAFHRGAVVHLAAGISCPDCRRDLRACDVIADQASSRAVLICSCCHRDILTIERGSKS
jgi:hypothetical protein